MRRNRKTLFIVGLASFILAGIALPAFAAEDPIPEIEDRVPAIEEPVPTGEEPAWLTRPRSQSAEPAKTTYGKAAWRSMGALVLVLAGLFFAQRALQRRTTTATPSHKQRLAVQTRIRLGVRQQLVVVEWEGDRLMLGVGPSEIRLLHARPGAEPENATASENAETPV